MSGPVDAFGALLDRAVTRTQALRAGRNPTVEALDHEARLARLRELRPRYDAASLAWPGLLVPGGPIAPRETPVRIDVRDLAWASAYTPWNPEVGDTYLAERSNDVEFARLFDGGASTVVVIHGYGAGHFPFEQHLWPVRAWRARGMSVVLTTLPFHGRRAPAGRRLAPPFPGADPRLNVEGFRQAVADLTALIAWLRAEGHGPIGVVGMSLGGYTTALLATLLPDLAYAGLVVPLSSIADFARDQGRLGEGPVADALHAELEGVLRPVSPFARAPRVPPDRVGIVAARGDTITGVRQAERLAAHFGVWVDVRTGSHTLQLGLRRALDRWMRAIGA